MCCRCAPEALNYRRFTVKGDVWSYGVTVWEIYTYGLKPELCDIKLLSDTLHKGVRLRKPPSCPMEIYKEIMLQCWKYEEKNRCSFANILDTIQRQFSLML